jgi:uncharacterized protein YbaR (Trm112 family)
MHLDVVPTLRCPNPHAEAALVLVADATRGRHVITGLLGCPVCEAEYPIRAGVAYFTEDAPSTRQSEEVETLRTAAMLGLTDAGGVIMLAGRWSANANAIAEIADALVLVVNPSAPRSATNDERVSVLYAGERLPIAARALRAAAIDEPMREVAATLRTKGRLVATSLVPVPPDITELARDNEYWVGESGPALALVRGLTRRDPMREREQPDVTKRDQGGDKPGQSGSGRQSGNEWDKGQSGSGSGTGTKPGSGSGSPGKSGGMKDDADDE